MYKEGWLDCMAKKEVKRFEIDLYDPVKTYFTNLGYAVYGEVKDCDVVAIKETSLLIVELKLTMNIRLLIQAAKRQRMTQEVFIAIPRPNYSLRSRKWQDLCYLVRRLELGLILVSFKGDEGHAEVVIQPSSFDRKKSMRLSKKRKASIVKETEGRSGDYNVGGSRQTEIISAYKETCIYIACCLKKWGPLSPKQLREIGTGEKTTSILNQNYYGWFNRVRRGVYELNEQGKESLRLYEGLAAHYEQKIDGQSLEKQ